MRVAVSYFTADSALGRHADRIAEALTDDLLRVTDLSVATSGDLRRLRGASVGQLRRALRLDVVVVGTVSGTTARSRVSLTVLDARAEQTLATTVDSAPGARVDALVRRLGVFVRGALVAHLDSLARRSRFAREDAWRLAEQSRGAVRAVYAAVGAGSGRSAALAMDRADSLLAAAAALEPGATLPPIQLARNRDRRAFVIEYLRQAMPDTAPFLPDPLAIRHSALPLLDSVLGQDSGAADALVLRAGVKAGLHRLGGPDSLLTGAIADLERALEIEPRNAEAWSDLASCHGAAGQYAEQLYAFERALMVDPFQVTRAKYLRGMFDAALAAGQLSRAEEACRTGMGEFPGEERFRDCELKSLGRTGASGAAAARALALADSLEPVEPNATSRAVYRIYAAQALARAGRGAEADRQTRLAEARVPETARAPFLLIELAAVRQLRHDRDSATALARRALTASPRLRQLLGDPAFASLRAALGVSVRE
ncbi:MAG: hypothetical protein A2085_08600 [Gemmatimonadetes bacterium GWC2_71_10]|nr:MAG: hypothetical protein A2085_08600 [Gemmatimonadetes bacterium GWC2_71_10]